MWIITQLNSLLEISMCAGEEKRIKGKEGDYVFFWDIDTYIQ